MTIPSSSRWYHSILARSTLLVLLAVFVAGLLGLQGIVWLVSARAYEENRGRLEELLATSERTVQAACYVMDAKMATEVAQGMLENSAISAASIRSGGVLLAHAERPARSLASADDPRLAPLHHLVYSPFEEDEAIGEIVLTPNPDAIRESVKESVAFASFLLTAQMLLTALAVMISVMWLVIRPIKKLSDRLHRMHAAGGERLLPPRGHERGELGRLVEDINDLADELVSALRTEQYARQKIEAGENALQESEVRYRTLFEGATDAIMLLRGSQIIDCNERTLSLLACRRQDIIGQTPLTFSTALQGDGRSSGDRIRELILATYSGQPQCFEWQHRGCDGREFAGEVSLKTIRVGEEEFILAMMRDITERKRVQDALEQAHLAAARAAQAKSDFLANMSHEIRTPLNAITGMTELMLSNDLSAKQRNYVNKIRGASDSLLHIINDILDFSKIEAGKLVVEQVPFELDQVLDKLTTLLAEKAAAKGIELAYAVDAGLIATLVGDPLRLEQILVNLLSNAIKFSERGTIVLRVEIETQESETCALHFSVSDQGVGIRAEQLDRLFTPFTQADTSTTRRYGGTGLGLAICKRLVELMQGQIWAESESGVGSTFHFSARLGMRSDSELRHARQRLQPLAARPVLLVDDNPRVRAAVSAQLQQLGLHVEAYADGRTALAAASAGETQNYLCALVDHDMPGMDGLATLRGLREVYENRPGRPRPAQLMMSAFNQAGALEERPEVDGWLLKPSNGSQIYQALAPLFGLEAPTRERPMNVNDGEHALLRGREVLLVEDTELNQEVIRDMLESAGILVRLANNGEEAIRAIESARPDCVLMDCQMPVMDGFEATRRLRSQKRFHDLPIVALTANALPGDREHCFQVGMSDYVTKPVKQGDLMQAIARQLGKRLPPTSPASPEDDAPPALPGVDTQLGLTHANGKWRLYRKLLITFRDKDAREFADGFQAALDAADWETATRRAHSLKSVAKTLGATPIGDQAAALEYVAFQRDAGACTAQLAILLPELTRLRAALAVLGSLEHLSESRPPTRITDDVVRPLT